VSCVLSICLFGMYFISLSLRIVDCNALHRLVELYLKYSFDIYCFISSSTTSTLNSDAVIITVVCSTSKKDRVRNLFCLISEECSITADKLIMYAINECSQCNIKTHFVVLEHLMLHITYTSANVLEVKINFQLYIRNMQDLIAHEVLIIIATL